MLFAEIKVGDEVAICWRDSVYRATVTRVTATQFYAGGVAYRRDDGVERGAPVVLRHNAKPLGDPYVAKVLERNALHARLKAAAAALPGATPEVQAQVFALLGV